MTTEEIFIRSLEEKLDEMEAEDYHPPRRFLKTDYVITALVVCISLAIVIAGAAL